MNPAMKRYDYKWTLGEVAVPVVQSIVYIGVIRTARDGGLTDTVSQNIKKNNQSYVRKNEDNNVWWKWNNFRNIPGTEKL